MIDIDLEKDLMAMREEIQDLPRDIALADADIAKLKVEIAERQLQLDRLVEVRERLLLMSRIGDEMEHVSGLLEARDKDNPN